MKEAFDHADDREDEDDLHLCLRCQSTIRGLDNYIRHRRTRDNCFRSEVKKVDLVDQRDCSTPLGGQSASPSPSHPESPLLLSLGLQQKAHQQHQEGNEPGTVRSRRPSSDEAAAFMETLGLKSSSSSSKPQQQQQQQQQHTLTNLFFQEQLPSFFSSCWEEHHQLFPSSSSDVQQLLSSSSSLQLLQKPNPHSLLSFDKPHHKQHHLASKLIEASGSNKSFLSPSLQNDFMRQIDLINVSHHGLEAEEGEVNPDPAPSSAPSLTPLTSTPTTVASSSCPQQEQQQQQEQPQPQPNPGGRWRLWIPEQEGCPEEGGEDALLLEDVLLSGLDSSCCYDPTLIEVASAVQEAQHQRHVVDDSSQQVHEEEVTNSKVTASASDVSPTKEKPVQQECQDLEALSSKYRCLPCDRTLASRELYEKHLLSELHFKRASSASSSISTGTGMKKHPYLLLGRGKSVTNPSTGTIRLRKKNKRYSSSSSETESCRPSLAKQPTAPKTDAGIINCESCSAPVNAWQYGKHLISHYHHHRSKLPKNHPTSVRLVLRHIEDIVRLAPFQCSVCQFYANWPHELLAHWESEFHLEHDQNNAVDNIKDDSANTYYWCSFCACLSSSSERMGDHLRGSKHAEIVDAISRHVPITIKKVRLHPCHLCDKQFRLRFSLKKHVRQAHKVKSFELPDHVRFECEHCQSFSTFSERNLHTHCFLAHPEVRTKYHCRVCRLQFKSKKIAESHRSSLPHRLKVKEIRAEPLAVSCEHCGQGCRDLQEMKGHVSSEHRDQMSQCGICGERFPFPQDLTAHVRGNKCGVKKKADPQQSNGQLLCGEDGCGFHCDSLNMILFHQSLIHLDDNGNEEGAKVEDKCFRCAVCDKTFKSRSRLWEHVRIHGDSHRCGECYRIFASSKSFKAHLRTAHNKGDEETDPGMIRKVLFKCSQCDYSTGKKKLLGLHSKRFHFTPRSCDICGEISSTYSAFHNHARKHSAVVRHQCPSCSYSAQTSSDLKSHQLIHKENVELFSCPQCDKFRCKRKSELTRHIRTKHEDSGTKHPCSDCDYVGASRQHLERHASTHDGEDSPGPDLQCRLCEFRCGSVDKMRKHILKTKVHSGASVYECSYCNFRGNVGFKFRQHLSLEHMEVFGTLINIERHVKSYFSCTMKSKVNGAARTSKKKL